MSLVLSQDHAEPGEVLMLSVRSTGSTLLGVRSSLDRWNGDSWQFVYVLLKGTGNEGPRHVKAGTETFTHSGGLLGEKEWPLKIPIEADPGLYRIREEVILQLDGSSRVQELEARLEIAVE